MLYAQIKSGKVLWYSPQKLHDCIRALEGQEVQICIEKRRSVRTTQQNRYYWLYLGLIEAETGNDSVDLHDYFKDKFLRPRYKVIFGVEIKLPATTTKLDTLEFGEYIRRIEILSGIPAPEI